MTDQQRQLALDSITTESEAKITLLAVCVDQRIGGEYIMSTEQVKVLLSLAIAFGKKFGHEDLLLESVVEPYVT